MRIEIEIPKTPEMNKYTKRNHIFCPGCDTEVTNCNYCPHGQKIDWSKIVKQGGASDDVCEWRLCDEEANVYDTSCRNPHILINGTPEENNYEFCLYCGKKIKVVE